MKYFILSFFVLTSTTIFSQNAVAELKFEEAETAFNSGDFELTIQKADEFENTLGNITDKSLYLRVVSQNKLFNPANFYSDEKQFILCNSLTANVAKYLKATENNGLNDKFKEVYAIGEGLKKLNLPKDKTIWHKENQRIEKEERDKQSAKIAQIEHCKKTFEDLTIDDLPLGITIEEFQKQYPNVLGENPKKIENDNWVIHYPKNNISFSKNRYGTVMDTFDEAGHNIVIITDPKNGGKISHYEKIIYFYKGKENKQSEYNSKKNDLLEKYKYLSVCASSHNSDGVFSVTYNNKTLEIVSIQEPSIYKISLYISKKL